MICPNCGKDVGDSKFCTYCGTAISSNEIAETESEKFTEETKTEATVNTEDVSVENEPVTEESPEVIPEKANDGNDSKANETTGEPDTQPIEKETTVSNEVLLTTNAGYGFKQGTLNLYSDKLEFTHPQGTMSYPISDIIKVRKSLGCLEITTHDNKTVSFGYNGNLVDQWVAKMIRMIPEENLNMSVENNAESVTSNNTNVSQQIPDIKQVGIEKAKEVIENYKNIKTQPKWKKIVYIALPIIILLVFIKVIGGGSGGDKYYIQAAEQVVSEQLRSPSTASFSSVKVVDKDKYGRALISMTVDAQNGFGAYIRDNYVVVIYDVNKREGTFRYVSPQSYKNSFLEDAVISSMKKQADWDEPLDSD